MKKLSIVLLGLCLGVTSVLPSNSVKAVSSEKIHFTVAFKSEQLPSNASKIIKDLGGEIVYSVPEIGVVEVNAPANFAKAAAKNAAILAANPALKYELPEMKSVSLDDASFDTSKVVMYNTYQWDIKRMTNNGESFNLNTGNHNVVVGVIDSGIDLNHPDLKANLLPGSKNFVPAGGLYGVDQSEKADPSDVQDRKGHGTHCAGSIAGNGGILGIAPNVGFRAYRIFGAEGGAYSSWIMKAIVAATNDGVDVISMSLGGIYTKSQYTYTDPSTGEVTKMSDTADYVAYTRAAKYANSKGILIVAAAGNDGINAGNKREVTEYANYEYGDLGYKFVGASFYTPATIPNVVTVSATGPNDELATYSNYGAGYVDVSAPGGDDRLWTQYENEGRFDEYINNRIYAQEFCLSCVPVVSYTKNSDGLITNYTYTRPGYSWYTGTSMATPKVAATAALIITKYGKMEPNKVKVLLQQSAEDIGQTGNDKLFGHGLVNTYNALRQ